MKHIETISVQKTTLVEVIPITKEFVFNLIQTRAHTNALPGWDDCLIEFFDELYYAVFPEDKPEEAKPEEAKPEQ